MNPLLILVFVTVFSFIVFFVVQSYFFNKDFKIKRKLKKSTYRRISDFKENEVAKIIGKAHSGTDKLIAPLSNRECLGFHVVIQQRKKTGKNSHWVTILNEYAINDFVVNDNNDLALIDTSNYQSVIHKDTEFQSGFLNDATPILEEFLKKHNLKSEGYLGFNKNLRYKEGIIDIGETVSVLGQGSWITQKLPNNSHQKTLLIKSYERQPVYFSDHTSTLNKS